MVAELCNNNLFKIKKKDLILLLILKILISFPLKVTKHVPRNFH